MKKLICGNMKFKSFNHNNNKYFISNKKNSMNEIQEEYYNNRKDQIENDYNITKKTHGFVGLILKEQNLVVYSCHTTKENSKILNEKIENINVNETWNPIKHVNPIQSMTIDNFFNFINITEPDKMLTAARHGKHKEEDMLYLTLRAFMISMKSFQPTYFINLDKDNSITREKNFTFDEINVYTPAEAMLIKNYEQKNQFIQDFKEIIEYLDDIKDNENAKINILKDFKNQKNKIKMLLREEDDNDENNI